jgi:hypothetical protein
MRSARCDNSKRKVQRLCGFDARTNALKQCSRDSDGLSERVRRRLKTIADLGQLSRGEIDSLLLDLALCLLAVSAAAQRLELHRHFLHRSSEAGELASHAVYVFLGGHAR